MVLDLENAGAFNAIVIDRVPGLLLNDAYAAAPDKVSEFWNSVGSRPVENTIRLAGELLTQMRAIKT